MHRRLPRSFYDRPCLAVARELLGMHLVHRRGKAIASGRIVEVEAYVGQEDRACHAWRGPTPRAKVMFGPPGRAYVYMIYGAHFCFNAVCEAEGRPAAVLVRALEPGDGVGVRTDGPGKLCAALGITREHNDLDLARPGELWIEDRGGPSVAPVATARINVDYAGEWAKREWRFVDPASAWLSRKLRPPLTGATTR